MEMQASRTLAVTQQHAWDALNDPEVLKLCIPGCDKVEPTGEHQYSVAMALKIGPVSAKFAGKITLSDIAPPESYTIAFDGSGGVAGVSGAVAAGMTVFGFCGGSHCRPGHPETLRAAGAHLTFADMRQLPGLVSEW